jgi:hypothetical protein
MTTLKRIRENREKSEKRTENKVLNYTPPEPMCLITKTIKCENLSLIDFICEKYDLASSEKEILIEKFIKVNYFCPNKILSRDKEKLQKIFI